MRKQSERQIALFMILSLLTSTFCATTDLNCIEGGSTKTSNDDIGIPATNGVIGDADANANALSAKFFNYHDLISPFKFFISIV